MTLLEYQTCYLKVHSKIEITMVRLIWFLVVFNFISGKKIVKESCQILGVFDEKIKCEQKFEQFQYSISPIQDATINIFREEFYETVFMEIVIFKEIIKLNENNSESSKIGTENNVKLNKNDTELCEIKTEDNYTEFIELDSEDSEDVKVPIEEETANFPMAFVTPFVGLFGFKIVFHIFSI